MKVTSILILCAFILASFLPASAAGNTYYVSPGGLKAAVDKLQSGDTLYLRAGIYNEPINLLYKSFTSTVTISGYPGEAVILDGAGIDRDGYNQPGLVVINHTNYVRITGLRVQNVNMAGIYAAYSDHVTIDHNSTYDTVSTGIGVWTSTNVLVDSNDVALSENAHPGYPQSGENFLKLYGVRGFEVKNNLIHKAANVVDGTGAEGMNIEASRDGTVHHNTVHMDERQDGQPPNKFAIAVDAWDGYDNSGKPIVTGNIEVYSNIAYNSRYGFIVTSEEGGVVDGVKIYNNVAYNIGVLDNCYNGGAAFGVIRWSGTLDGPKRNIQFVNNTAYNSCYGFLNNSPQAQDSNIQVRNNIFSSSRKSSISLLSGSEGRFTLDHNLSGDAKFVDAAGADFHLQPNSPAINAGSQIGAPPIDFDEQARSGSPDMGAYEYAGPAPTPSPTATRTPQPSPTYTRTPAPSATPSAVVTTPAPAPTSPPSCQKMVWPDMTIEICRLSQ